MDTIRPVIRRLAIMVSLAAGLTGLLLTLGLKTELSDDQSTREPPVAAFSELDGTWEGTFVGYDRAGNEVYRIKVKQIYETVDEQTQRVRIEDHLPDGRVITGEGENTATLRPDGSLELRCVVTKSDGDRVEHTGRVVQGPDGTDQIIWSSAKAGRVETFREVVHEVDGEWVYEINGMGNYNGTMMLMAGRYVRQDTED